MRLQLLASIVLVCAVLPAQRAVQKPEIVEEELAKKERKLTEVESTLQRLHELRLRHDFGLQVRAERYFALDTEQAELVRGGAHDRLAAEESEVQRLSVQAAELGEQLDAAQQALRERAADQAEPSALPPPVERHEPAPRILPRDEPYAAADTSSVPRITPPEPVSGGQDTIGPPAEHSIVITGSGDHSAVGRVLLRAGEDLLLRASTEADSTAVAELRERATQLIESAKRELEPLAEADEPALIDLYHLARCEEKLGNLAAADSLFAQIISLDKRDMPDGTESYGEWGRAAQAAKAVLRWLSDTGSWKPARDVDEIRWEEK